MWENHRGKAAVIILAGAAGAAILYTWCEIAKPKSPAEKSVRSRMLLEKGTYNKDIDARLKFIAAEVSNTVKDVCDAGGDISWDTLQGILLQHPVLQSGETTHRQETFAGEFTEPKVKTWLHEFVTEYDTDVYDAVRIHDDEITEVIRFVANQSVSNSASLLDIGMIRFPTKDNPYVKLYRIQLTGAFSGSSHIMPSGGDETRVLTATVDSCNYYPNDIVLQRINPEYVDKTIARFEDMLLRD